jgi:non-ribosomal peptide synthetase component F
MYPGDRAITRAEQPMLMNGQTGESLTYRELEARTNRLAHLLRARGSVVSTIMRSLWRTTPRALQRVSSISSSYGTLLDNLRVAAC